MWCYNLRIIQFNTLKLLDRGEASFQALQIFEKTMFVFGQNDSL